MSEDKDKLSKQFGKKGFTLIEMLLVIVIIGLLSSIILVSVNTARTQARYARAKADLNQFLKLINVARADSLKTFIEITGSGCSECTCRGKGNIQLLPETDSCWITYQNAVSALNNVASGAITFNRPISDPWGAPYLFNENEGEACCCPDAVNWCCTDNILSAGPNGVYYDSDDINVNLSTAKCYPIAGPHHANVNW